MGRAESAFLRQRERASLPEILVRQRQVGCPRSTPSRYTTGGTAKSKEKPMPGILALIFALLPFGLMAVPISLHLH